MTNDILNQRFRKVLVARYSPTNSCFVPDGGILYGPAPVKKTALRHGSEYDFLSVIDHKTPCRYGWVQSVPNDLSVGEFVGQYFGTGTSSDQVEVLAQLFKQIANLPDGTPVAGSFFKRGVEESRIALDFHKVIFYPGDKKTASAEGRT
jgi:hypothetical protein